ncbi:MAG: diaminopimelate decarboxylase [Chloroflexi bacterium]|nr:diaminopimelate decarboxylase [Chloroflexota bacterium]MBM3174144.1 diaminopimelate decarboxylase [Chloroflexota bacterium]MBM4449212.1 diaminopimelate decarboxylase [Chloroflexota bacterium]
MSPNNSSILSIFPFNTKVNSQGHLVIGGCDATALAQEFGTPLYVLDEFTIRTKCQEFRFEFSKRYPDILVIYAAKAFINPSLANIIKQEGLGMDVVSGGELSIAQSAAFPPEKVYFHGNNKTASELKLALNWGIGRVVVDNLFELDLLNKMAQETNKKQDILLRINPGVDPHTHRFTTTGILDSKFGLPLTTGQAEAAIIRASSASHLSLLGLHFHLGSPISEINPYQVAIELALKFAQKMKAKHGFDLRELSPGGGFAVQYTPRPKIPSVSDYADAIVSKLKYVSDKLNLAHPRCTIEPGRGVLAQAGVALYSIGSIKKIPKVRTYAAVDGGIGDNIRPALYQAKYEAIVANKANQEMTTKVTIAGRYCESGDILVKDVVLPPLSPGDIIAIPASGAYSIPMSSNYNAVPRPAIVMVKDGEPRLVRRRESYQDLISLDIN